MLKKLMFVLFLFLGASLHSQSLNFLTPVDISVTSTGATNPQIDFNSSGNGICVWSQTVGANTLILAARTTNFGVSWETPVTISTPGANAINPQVSFGTNGNAVCIWLEGSGPSLLKASKTNDGGITWATPVALSATNALVANLAFDSFHNMFCVAWQTPNPSTSTFSSSSADNGATWTMGVVIDSRQVDFNVKLSFDSAGNGIVFYSTYNGSSVGTVSTCKTTNGGISWTTPVIVFQGGTSICQGHQIIAPAMWGTNEAVCVFTPDISPYVAKSSLTSNGSLAWSTPNDISSVPSAEPRAAFNPSGNIVAVWVRADVGNIVQISNSANGGLNWGTPINFSSSPGLTSQQISMSGSNAIALWLKSDGANNLVQAIESSDSGATWSTPIFISPSGQTALTPQIKVFSNVASNGGPVAVSVWVSDNGGNFTVQSATTFVESPISGFSASGEQSIINGLFQKDIVNKISWTSIASAVTYRVYSGNTLLYQGLSPYYQHGLKSGIEYSYSVRWVDALGVENDPLTITLP